MVAASTETSPGIPVRGAPAQSVRDLVADYPMVHGPYVTVESVVASIRSQVADRLIVYVYVLVERRLVGVVAMRDLLLAKPAQKLEAIMLQAPFALKADTPILEAMRQVLDFHFPIYPVVEADGTFLGVVRGADLFRAEAIHISAQAGSMVGVNEEEGARTPVIRSLRFRHPWLQFNLFTCCISAAIVHFFEGTIAQYVILAVFLPVMTGQTTNIGCQALAVALRALTLGEILAGGGGRLLRKELWLGLWNGLLTGITAALAIGGYAWFKGDPHALTLTFTMLVAMVGACMVSGVAGAAVPLGLKRAGLDPAMASSIFLTTIAEAAGLLAFLGIASVLLP